MNRDRQLLSTLGLTGILAVSVIEPAFAQIAQITQIRLSQTSNGLEVILETAEGKPLQAFTYTYGETLVADIITTQLRLDGTNTYRADNPAPGIASVEVFPLDAYSVRVRVTGTSAVPAAQIVEGTGNFVLSVRPGVGSTAVQPPVTPPTLETPDPTQPTQPTQPAQPSQPTTPTPPAADLDDVDVPVPDSQEPTNPTQPSLPALPTPDAGTPQPPQTTEPSVPPPATSQDPEVQPIEIVVTATRTEQSVAEVPRSVTVVTRQEIQQQTAVSRDLQEILGTLTPGLGAPTDQQSNFAQSMRGRRPLVLIDGVPVSSNNATAFSRDLRSIDPGAVERVEIVRGPSAIYGDGASGGIINIITRRPTSQTFVSSAEIGVNTSLGKLEGDSFGTFGRYSISGSENIVDYVLSLSRESTGGFFDAEGDRIPQADSGREDTDTIDVLGKVGLTFGENDNQRLQLTVNHFKDDQDLNFFSDPIVEELPGFQKARALERDLQFVGTEDPGNRNTVASLQYNHNNIFGNSQLQILGYYRETRNSGSFFDERTFNPDTEIGIARTVQEQERWGGRLQINTPVATTASVLWGVDYVNEDLAETFDIFDTAAFDNSDSRILRKIDERTFAPWHNVENLGIFAQGQWDISPQWGFSGGVRYEKVGVSVPDYTTSLGVDVEGGDRDFDATVFNIGVVYQATQEVSLFANFAQGFSVPTIARILYEPPEGFNFERDVELSEPQRVDNFELGVRGFWDNIQVSLAAFYNSSDLGATVVYSDDPNRPGRLERAPQRNYGIEATLDWQVGSGWQLGGLLSWTEGENDLDEDDEYLALDSSVIQPLKIVAYVEHQTTPTWRNRLQALYVGDRDRALDDEVDVIGIESYFVVDYISSIDIGPGTLEIGIQNLLDNQYINAANQWLSGFGDSLYVTSPGRTVSVGYRLTW
jgi:iron complex outermembrane receptor protein